MPYRQLRILVEGNDDERFFERIRPFLEKKYDFVQTWQYQQQASKQIKNFLQSIREMNSSYFFVTDINRTPCVTAKKNSIKRKYGARIDFNNLIIVAREVEGWYLAGLDDKSCEELGLEPFNNTDDVTKEHFNKVIPNRFASRIDFMVEILKKFSISTAKRKNRSFSYFMSRI